MKKQVYTVGFLFSSTYGAVGLIRKDRPAWQFGRLNGVGGKAEGDEWPLACMIREFGEEIEYPAGEVGTPDWRQFARLNGKDFEIYCFAAFGDPTKMKAKTSEKVVVVPVADINPLRTKEFVENTIWLVGAAIDFLEDERPHMLEVYYE